MNIENFLNRNYEFKYNEILSRTYYKEKNDVGNFNLLKTYKFNSIVRQLNNNEIKASVQGLKCLLESDYVKIYNPFKDYFENLPEWDKTIDYIEQLASTVKTTDDELFKWAFKKWLVAFVACAINESEVNHSVLILTGKQGSGKTTWLMNLIPNELREYGYSGNIKPGNKDSNILLSEKILINIDELASYSKAQVEAYKELITKDKITERRAYGYFSENYIRRASFVGSSNHNQILMDVTGNRRFLVFESKDIAYNLKINYKQLYAQVMFLYKTNFKHYFDKEDIGRIELNNEKYKQTSIEEEYIDKYFSTPKFNDEESRVFMNATEVIEYLKKNASAYININVVSIGKLLKAKGFTSTKRKGLKKFILVKN
ncbi:VapE domain-containing protein [Polaribacter septentrionalilitoris]|uniref:VapE domain-containing protein n=1 Tax=Polaribacter septentrionalilitoris TaxID=2494657 RepID=UPI00135A475C|nr:VapE domain-containing protein [Polaribacter septentrionalilitoris]